MKVGDQVRKVKGYQFEGTIVALFTNSKGQQRAVVEHEGSQTPTNGGMLHIFALTQLEAL